MTSNAKNTVVWPGWEVVRRIGAGSFGAVYEIERKVLDKTEKAALKVITIPQNANDVDELYSDGYDEESITERYRSYLEDIIREYSMMAEMKGHTNVVYCDDFRYIQHDDGIGWDIYIKMELLTPLTKALPKEISEEQVTKIGVDLCNALILCEDRNIVHRDIKPQNIFVSQDGNYKLGDFGIAKTAERTTSGTKIGTYKYMAPEVYNNQPYGHGADIYSLGLVLYWLLNERRTPFLPMPPKIPKTSEEDEARKRRFSGEDLPAPRNGSDALKRIVLKACAYDPKDRYRSAKELQIDLLALRNSKASTGTPAGAAKADNSGDVMDATVSLDDMGTVSLNEPGTVNLDEQETIRLSDEIDSGLSKKTQEERKSLTKGRKLLAFGIAGVAVLLLILFFGIRMISGRHASGETVLADPCGITVAGKMAEGAELTVTELEADETLEELLPDGYAAFAYYELDCTAEAKDGYRITFPVPGIFAEEPITISCIDGKETWSETQEAIGGSVSIHVESLAKYLLEVDVGAAQDAGWSEWYETLSGIDTGDAVVEIARVNRGREKETLESDIAPESEEAETELDGWTFMKEEESDSGPWGAWTDERRPEDEQTEEESLVQYRYRDVERTSSDLAFLDGWTAVDSAVSYSDYGDWSEWSADGYQTSDTRNVDSKIQYSYRDVISKETFYTDWSGWGDWSNTEKSESDLQQVETRIVYEYPAHYLRCNICGSTFYSGGINCVSHVYRELNGVLGNDVDGDMSVVDSIYVAMKQQSDDHSIAAVSGGYLSCVDTSVVTTSTYSRGDVYDGMTIDSGDPNSWTQYRVRTRSTYDVIEYTDWSAYQDTAVTATDSREVQTKTLYRYRDREASIIYYFERYGEWSDWRREKPETADNIEIEERTAYRYRNIADSTIYYYSRWGDWTDWDTGNVNAGEDTDVETILAYRYSGVEERPQTSAEEITSLPDKEPTKGNGWDQDGDDWYYYDEEGKTKTGWLEYNGIWYFFDDAGKMKTGWLKQNDTWYYLDEGGRMLTGWFQVKDNRFYADDSGALVTGETREINGITYTFDSDGYIVGVSE